jgi:hypothetical protein
MAQGEEPKNRINGVLQRDPLSEVTRRERRSLLVVSLVALAMVHASLVPERIAALGLEFARVDRQKLLFLVGAIVVYFILAFSIYAATDWTSRRVAFLEAVAESYARNAAKSEAEMGISKAAIRRVSPGPFPEISQGRIAALEEKFLAENAKLAYLRSRWSGKARVAFDYILPLVVGAYAAGAAFGMVSHLP